MKLNIFVLDDSIVVQNQKYKSKHFPRCGITEVESFVLNMVKDGQLDDLLH
ncbi:hypothetical protein [Candidatus Nitrosopumilus sediminis]|uniref:hypothetical protein n=1 Tax=Candidatus Nitrosopumilus sediminis TaxID=1229909 RepID=UPI00138ADEB2|nr:hypothetical protein [Candidatus Nitrosopumilus sediminis]